MQHKHLKECESTQNYLKENIADWIKTDSELLVSTAFQSKGLGRQGNTWVHYDSSLAFSFTLKPNSIATLTPLEVGAILADYFNSLGYQLSLKWPNDLLNSKGEKCGGILCHFHDISSMIVGVGLNFGDIVQADEDNFKLSPGVISSDKVDSKLLPQEIFQYLLDNRLEQESVKILWDKYCIHQNKNVEVIDNSSSIEGLFIGLGENGEALIKTGSDTKKIISGSLFLK